MSESFKQPEGHVITVGVLFRVIFYRFLGCFSCHGVCKVANHLRSGMLRERGMGYRVLFVTVCLKKDVLSHVFAWIGWENPLFVIFRRDCNDNCVFRVFSRSMLFWVTVLLDVRFCEPRAVCRGGYLRGSDARA